MARKYKTKPKKKRSPIHKLKIREKGIRLLLEENPKSILIHIQPAGGTEISYMAPQNSETPLTRAQRQDELLNMFPGTAKVILRPRTNPDGSEIVTISDYEFPDLRCKRWLKNLYQAMRLCGRDYGRHVAGIQLDLPTFCGIEVDLDAMEKAMGNGLGRSIS